MKTFEASRSARHLLVAVVAMTSYGASALAVSQGDSARGARAFQACMACHSTKAGEDLTGPSLANVWQRKAGTVAGFHRYSDAMKRVELVWAEETLDKWLSNPEQLIPGTSMTFAGLRESKDRQDVIAYLKSVSAGKAPTLAQGGGMMNMATAKVDLKAAPLQGQVTAISHCGDTYTVRTADGKDNKAWEFNLRFKTDSSKLGPSPGKPVIVGAGMQGDRASVVFATPSEISRFISERCPDAK
jgi:cytochrome c